MVAKEDKKSEKEKPKKSSKKKAAKPKAKEEPKIAESIVKESKTEAVVSEPSEKVPATKKKKAKTKKKSPKVFVARGKRKESVARATIKVGKGAIRINSVSLDALNNKYIREIIREPLRYVGPEASTVDISVNVYGGGIMGQAQASRTAIAKALAAYFEELKLKEKFISIDRSLMIEDTRRVESKKDCGPKARARYQKSYR